MKTFSEFWIKLLLIKKFLDNCKLFNCKSTKVWSRLLAIIEVRQYIMDKNLEPIFDGEELLTNNFKSFNFSSYQKEFKGFWRTKEILTAHTTQWLAKLWDLRFVCLCQVIRSYLKNIFANQWAIELKHIPKQ